MTYVRWNVAHAVREKDLDDMPQDWRDEFEREVGEGNFLRGGTCLLLIGGDVDDALLLWHRCLVLGGFGAYLTDPQEIVRRLDGKFIPGDEDQRKEDFDNAECYVLLDFFRGGVTEEQAYTLAWWMRSKHRDGAVIVIGSPTGDPDLATYGDNVGEQLEQRFEVINVAQPDDPTPSQRQHGGAQPAVGSAKRKVRRKPA